MDKVFIGLATKPQALKGEFRCKPVLNNFKLYKNLSNIYIDNKIYKIEKTIIRDTFIIFKVEGINCCEEAELLRNKEIYAFLDNYGLDNPSVLNYQVVLDGNIIGKIVDVNNYGSTDVLSIHGDKNLMLPFVDNLANIDSVKKLVILNKEIFNQVVVYEN